ncbi:transglycosylase domain-containing protein [Faunimonas sp. B44]|uniref:transglycosylase domain-containing protein n=1 Tax=Faunimonas sp. B44 TaxID=3461493 RepID=UPI004043E6D8
MASRKAWFRLLAVDAWIDSTLYEAGQGAGDWYERVVAFTRRFRLSGFSRALSELASESVTLGTAGALVLLAFGVPAFESIKSNWLEREEFAVTFLDRYGNEIGRRGVLQDDIVSLEDLPDHLIQAVLATEDRRFFTHFGIDVLGTVRAIVENAKAGGVVQGGSSITQQLAKNLFLSNERTLQRKIKEAYLALWLEANLTKREILKLYLDRAYMGGGTFGVNAASEFYFGKDVQDLELSESAMLAGLFKAPTKFAPHINLPAARARANDVLTRLVDSGMMTEGQVVGARRNPATPVERSQTASPDYFLDWAFQEVKRLAPGPQKVLIARTTIDMRLQRAAEAAVESSLRERGDAFRVKQAALVAMEPDGTVRAMVGGRDYGTSTFNRATNALRQPGSSFKPYVYAVAMQNGFTPDSVIVDAPISIGNWSPQNYGRKYAGRVTLRSALARSINTVPVRLSISFGRQPIADMAAALGVDSPVRVTRALPLGTSEVTVLDMASGYSAFANGGHHVDAYGVLEIRTPAGETLYDASERPEPQRVLDDKTVAQMVDMLHAVVEAGTGRRARLPGINAAGKTGTTQGYRDAWYIGFTGNYTAAVWFGNDDFRPTKDLTGGTLPAETWQKFMRVAHAYADIVPLPGLPPPKEPREEQAVASAGQSDPMAGLAAVRLAPSTIETLDRIGGAFKRAERPLQTAAERHAALPSASPSP